MMEFKRTYRITERDCLAFCFYQQRKLLLISPFAIFLSLLTMNCFIYREWNLISTYVAIIISVFMSMIIGLITCSQSNAIVLKGNLSKLDMEMIINEKGIYHNSKLGEMNLSFEQICNVYETRTTFYIYYSKTNALIFPKKALNSQEEIQQLRELFKGKLNRKDLLKIGI